MPSASLGNLICAEDYVRLYTNLISLTPQTNLGHLKDHISDEEIQTLSPFTQAHAANMYLNQGILKMSILSRVS